MKRSDIKQVIVRYADGSVTAWDDGHIREGHAETFVNMDGPEKGRQEWDVFSLAVAGKKRPVRQA